METSPNPLSTPNPDPTVLTTAQLIREIGIARDIYEAEVRAIRKSIEDLETLVIAKVEGNQGVVLARILHLENSLAYLQRRAEERIPELVYQAVNTLRELHDEKFHSIDMRFIERDRRNEQIAGSEKTALAAALQSQKESATAMDETNSLALNKLETNFSKLIEQMQTLLNAVSRNTDEKINDLKSRLDRGEGRVSVSDPATSDSLKQLAVALGSMKTVQDVRTGAAHGSETVWAFIFAAFGIGVGVASVIANVLMHSASVPH